MGNSHNFEEIRTKTIQERNERLEKFLPIFQDIIKAAKITPSRIDHITRMEITTLVDELNQGRITSQQLIAIFGERAATIGRKNCVITEDYFEYALAKARQCDQKRRMTKKCNWTMNDEWNMDKFFPPLYGIPTSVKENIDIEGTRSTLGVTVRAKDIIKQDCATIKCFKHTGLIPFIKTNVPQLAFNFDSFNFLWGRTLNPWHPNKSAGGSSGGEGAAIAWRISPIGIGNDMAGSIRIPAAFNGVCGLCSSADRLPFNEQICNYSTGFAGLDSIMCVNGPLSNSIDGLALWMRNMTIQEFYLGQHDAYKKLIPFDIKTYKEVSEGKNKYKIGYIPSFQMIEPTPAIKRAVAQTVDFLKKQGHELVELTMPNQRQLLMSCFTQLLCQGDMKSFVEMLQGEDVVSEYAQLNFLVTRGWCLFNCIKCIIQKKYPRLGMVVQAIEKRSTHDYLVNAGRMHEMQNEWIRYWRKNKIDFLIMPGFATEAQAHGNSKDGSYLATYTYVFNLLKMTASSLPVTVTRADELHYESDWQDPVTELIRNNLKDSEGLPVSIQVIGLPFHEERVLGLSKKIESHFKFYQKHPLPKTE